MSVLRWPIWSLLLLSTSLAASDLPPRSVSVLPLEQLLIYPERSAPATVESLNHATLASETTGRLAKVLVRVGDRVASGQVVAELNCDVQRLKRQQAEAAQAASEARRQFASYQWQRAQSLAKSNNISDELLNQRQADATAAVADHQAQQAGLALARREEGQCQVAAPFAGVVTARLASEGDLVASGTPLLRLLDTQRLEVVATVQEEDLAPLAEAKGLRFSGNSGSAALQLRQVVSLIDTRSRTREVRLVPAAAGALISGDPGRLFWQSSRPLLPPDRVVQRGSRYGIFLYEGDRVRFVALSGVEEGRPVAVDLPLTSQVVVLGRHALQDGDAVRIVAE
jgi:RND family efflux transporter MFP subunit